MRSTIRSTLAVALPLLVATAAKAQGTLPASVTQRIDSAFAQYDSRTSPGCALNVIRDGTSVFAKGYGMSDFQHDIPIAPSSVFHVASISKHFTSMSIVLLAEEGKLSLDDDIRKYVPEVPDFGDRITIRHLIHHTSGLRDQWQLLSLSGWRPDDPKSESDILWLVSRQRALNFVPGAEHLYSNTGYTLLGTIVQRVSGKSLRQFTTERIFAPLGMDNTHFHDDHTMIVPGRTSAYTARPGNSSAGNSQDRYRISIPVFDNAGATSLFTTVEDMAKWERNFLQPKVGSARTIAQMHERGILNNGDTLDYAFALVHGEYRGLRTAGHGGADAGYRSDYLRFPDQRMAFVTFCNLASSNPAQLNREVAAIVLQDKMAPNSPPTAQRASITEVPIDTAMLRSLAGLYFNRTSESGVELVYHESTRMLHTSRNPASARLVHVGNNEFVVTGPMGQEVARARLEGNGLTMVRGTQAMRYERVNGPVLTTERLEELSGRYRSEELDVDWNIVVVRDSVLALQRRRTPDQNMNPLFEDAFGSGVGNIRFVRDASGRVTGFLLSAGRVRHMLFERRD